MKNGNGMRWKDTWSSVYGRMGMVFLTASAVAVLIFLADNQREFPENEKGEPVVDRGSFGEGSKEEELYVKIGETKAPFTVEVTEEKYTSSELEKVFAEAEVKLETLILGDNQSLDEVRSDLNLVTEIPDTGIKVSWELDHYDAMNVQGELQTDKLTESGTFVKLKAILSYEEKTCEYQFYAKLYPPIMSSSERMLQELQNEIVRADEETSTDSQLVLPENLEGERIIWSYGTEYRAMGILLLGAAMSLFLYASDQQKQKDAQKEREKALIHSYPQMVSKFTLYIRAGMTPKKAWYKIAEDYEMQKGKKNQQFVYEEMAVTMREMKSGAPEGECYEHFGERCGLPVYRKFGTMLSQNLKKGTKGMADILKQEADNAFEERKRNARKLGEEAGTKMLLPMFLMLAVVLVMIIIPAFLTVQI
ncbi:MAG: type II secretion system F family protein [Ruminococcus sp.]|nr:type II secretion system F family protein [Ruminococcus sp.]